MKLYEVSFEQINSKKIKVEADDVFSAKEKALKKWLLDFEEQSSPRITDVIRCKETQKTL